MPDNLTENDFRNLGEALATKTMMGAATHETVRELRAAHADMVEQAQELRRERDEALALLQNISDRVAAAGKVLASHSELVAARKLLEAGR